MIYVLYHANCLDGFGAAYAAWKRFGDDAEYVPVKYQEGWPTEVQPEGNEIYILDFSFDRDTLLFQEQLASKLVVIDHHKSAAEALAGLEFAQFDMERSGAVMAWNYFHPTKEVPELLLYIQDRDLWQFKRGATKAVCETLWAYPKDFDRWDNWINEPYAFGRIKREGDLLLLAKRRVVAQICYGSFECKVEGRRAIACNAPVHVSEVCHELLDRHPEAELAIGFRVTSEQLFRWDFRSRKGSGVDVSKVAALFKGGGHENAAGAKTEFNILEEL